MLLRDFVHRYLQVARAALRRPSHRRAPLGSMTLDPDDVILAQQWLNNRSNWQDADPVTEYEAAFAKWNGSKHAFASMGGRVSLSAAIFALELQPGDEVIVPGYTCVVVPNAFHFSGVVVRYCDIELDTFGLDVSQIDKHITSRTKAIVLQHLYGLVCRDYNAILDLAEQRGLRVIEDCAHATGAQFQGSNVGTRGDIGFYSTEQSKIFNTVNGGIAVTNNNHLADRLRLYHQLADKPSRERINKLLYNVILNYFQNKYIYQYPERRYETAWVTFRHEHKRLISTTSEEMRGIKPSHYGLRMPAPLAAIGLNQLRKVDRYNRIRRRTALEWDRWSEQSGFQKPLILAQSTPVYLRYPVLVEREKKLDPTWAEKALGVELGVWFVSQIHPVRIKCEGCPNAEVAVERCVNFPTIV